MVFQFWFWLTSVICLLKMYMLVWYAADTNDCLPKSSLLLILLPDSPKFSWSHSSSKCRHFFSLYAHRCGMWLRAGLWESHTRYLTGSALKERVLALIYPFLLSDCNVAPLDHPVNLKWWLYPRMVAGHRSPDFSLIL